MLKEILGSKQGEYIFVEMFSTVSLPLHIDHFEILENDTSFALGDSEAENSLLIINKCDIVDIEIVEDDCIWIYTRSAGNSTDGFSDGYKADLQIWLGC